MTANASIARVILAITGKPAGVGKSNMAINTIKLMIIHSGLYSFFSFLVVSVSTTCEF